MDLEEEDIQEFCKLWEEEFKETISPADARREASLLLELYALLAKPLPKPTSPPPLPCDISCTVENPARTKIGK